MKNIRKIFLFLIMSIITSCVAIKQDKILTIDDFVGEYGDEKETWVTFIKKTDDKKYNEDLIISDSDTGTIFCKFYKSTTKRVYLDCYNPNTEIEESRYPYVKLKLEPYGWVKIEVYKQGKKYYEKYNCADEEDASHYTQRCKESSIPIGKRKEE